MQLPKVDPPATVIDAFRDVQRARADRERCATRPKPTATTSCRVPAAKRSALIQEAAAYREQIVSPAQGDAERFLSVYDAYSGGREDVTAQRLYLETMEQVLRGTNKVIIDGNGEAGANGVVPYLPLPELQRRRPAAARPGRRSRRVPSGAVRS